MIKIPNTFTIREYRYNLKIIKNLRFLECAFYIVLSLGVIWAVLHNPISLSGALGVVLIIAIDFFAYRSYLKEKKLNDKLEEKNENSWGLGAVAELMVQDELESLSSNYRILSDFRIGNNENIDFIIICERGIFSIEVKSSAGLINYSDNKLYSFRRPLRDGGGISQTLRNAARLSDLLKEKFGKQYFVQGVLEFPRGEINRNSINRKIENVWIGGIDFYKYAIKKSYTSLSSREVQESFDYLSSENIKRNKIS